MKNLDRTISPDFTTSETIMGLLLVAKNMRQFMEGFVLGATVLMVEAVGNGVWRLFTDESLTNWISGGLDSAKGGN